MALETIKDFDFGTGNDFKNMQRVGTRADISKAEKDFILWIMLEQEFYRAKFKRLRFRNQIGYGRGRTQHDGFHKDEECADEEDGDDSDSRNKNITGLDLDNEKVKIAKQNAEKILQSAGVKLDFNKLSESYRHNMLIQLCKGCDLISGDSIKTAPEIFRKLRSSRFRSSFDVRNLLGKGGFGQVFHVTPRSSCTSQDQDFAVKKISVSVPLSHDNMIDLESALNESQFLKKLKGHRNIVELHHNWLEIESNEEQATSSMNYMYDDDDDDEVGIGPLKFYIQLEFCGESLKKWKEANIEARIPPRLSQVISLAFQLFDGLAYIHEKGIIHLDINPRNILWKNASYEEIKIIDFGLACEGDSCPDSKRPAESVYVATDNPLTPKSDVYSAAITMVEVAKNVQTTHELVKLRDEKDVTVGQATVDALLLNSIDKTAVYRPSAMEFKDGLLPLCNTD